MPHNIDSEPVVITVPANVTAPVNEIPAAEWIDYKSRVAAIEGLGLVDLSDVDMDSLDNGMVLQYDADDDVWRATALAPSSVSTQSDGSSTLFGPVLIFDFRTGLSVTQHPEYPTLALVTPVYGSSANTIAEGNHSHIQPAPSRWSWPPSGYMGGGSRSIGGGSITLAAGIPYVVEAEVYGQFRGADPGAAYYTLSINIGGDVRTSPGGTDGFWCVQGVPDKIHWEHSRRLTGAGTGVSVSASVAFHSGAGFNVDRTYLKVRLRPDR